LAKRGNPTVAAKRLSQSRVSSLLLSFKFINSSADRKNSFWCNWNIIKCSGLAASAQSHSWVAILAFFAFGQRAEIQPAPSPKALTFPLARPI
jgi:hypothetical protein